MEGARLIEWPNRFLLGAAPSKFFVPKKIKNFHTIEGNVEMTYRELQKSIEEMTDEQKDCDVSIVLLNTQDSIPAIDFVHSWESANFYGPELQDEVMALGIDIADGVLDNGHPYITIDF